MAVSVGLPWYHNFIQVWNSTCRDLSPKLALVNKLLVDILGRLGPGGGQAGGGPGVRPGDGSGDGPGGGPQRADQGTGHGAGQGTGQGVGQGAGQGMDQGAANRGQTTPRGGPQGVDHRGQTRTRIRCSRVIRKAGQTRIKFNPGLTQVKSSRVTRVKEMLGVLTAWITPATPHLHNMYCHRGSIRSA